MTIEKTICGELGDAHWCGCGCGPAGASDGILRHRKRVQHFQLPNRVQVRRSSDDLFAVGPLWG